MNNKIKSGIKLVVLCVASLFLLILAAGCSRSHRQTRHKPAGKNNQASTAIDKETTITTSLGDRKLLNQDLPVKDADLATDVNSIYYGTVPDSPTNGDDFTIEGWTQPAPGDAPAPVPTSTSRPTPAYTPQDAPAPVPTITRRPTPAPSPVIAPPVQNQGNDLQAQLKKARARKSAAFERYTKLVTTGGQGDVQQALKEYRQSYFKLKELEARAAGGK